MNFLRRILSLSSPSNGSASPAKIEPQHHHKDSSGMARSQQRQQDLGKSYVEQCLSVEQLAEIYSDSYIDPSCPENSDGLSTLEARKRLLDGGMNVLPLTRPPSNWALLYHQYFYKFWLLLIGAGILSLIAYFMSPSSAGGGGIASLNLTCAVILIGIVLVMSLISCWQERKTIDILSGLQQIIPHNCGVIRDCSEREISSRELVVGDLRSIRSGQQIYADLRILSSNGLKIEASAITGDGQPIEYTHEAAASHVSVFDAHNIAFAGSYCTEGDGIGLVIRTGKYTMMGNFAEIESTAREISRNSLLNKELSRFVNTVCFQAIGMSLLFFCVGMIVFHFQDILQHFIMGSLIFIVANVPQGLPPTFMCQLAIIARRLSKKNAYLKKFDVIDELGAATVIAVDKAGTLTKNQLVVQDLWYNASHHSALEEVKKTHMTLMDKSIREEELDGSLQEMLVVMAMCNKAHYERTRRNQGRGSCKERLQASKVAAAAVVKEEGQGTSSTRKKTFTVVHPSGEQTNITSSSTPRGGMSRINTASSVIHPSGDFTMTLSDDRDDQQPDDGRTLSFGQTMMRRSTAAKYRSLKPPIGCALDTALLRFVSNFASVNALRGKYQQMFEIPFNSVRCWQLVVAEYLCAPEGEGVEAKEAAKGNGSLFVVMIKGAPELILPKCSQALVNGKLVDIDTDFKGECQKVWEYYGSKGMRVIALAKRTFISSRTTKFSSTEANFPTTNLVLLGLISLLDPPRPDSKLAIKQCKEAGIKIYMITGDHATAAYAIASRVGLISNKPSSSSIISSSTTTTASSVRDTYHRLESGNKGGDWALVLGESMFSMTKGEWDALLAHPYIVFARTTPEQKLRIVEECQHRGEIVAVTGGGVNDSPSLAKANVGIAMGVTGSDVARKAANIVLTDDNFSSIVKGIEEGRLLFDNLRLSIAYTLAHLWPEVFPIILTYTLGLPLGLDPLQILSIDLACELPPAISLAFEPAEKDIMRVPPRRKEDAVLVSNQLMLYAYVFAGMPITLGCFLAYMSVYWHHGIGLGDLLYSTDYFQYNSASNFTTSEGRVFGVEKQLEIKGQAAASWQITLIVCQIFHLFMCTTRRVSFFQHGMTNVAKVLAVIAVILLLNFFVYTPSMQHFLRISTPPSLIIWIFGPIIGVYLIVFNEVRKYVIRNHKETMAARIFQW